MANLQVFEKSSNNKRQFFLNSILGDMEMHKWLWKCITETNIETHNFIHPQALPHTPTTSNFLYTEI